MGPDLGELYHALSSELQWMVIRWLQFRQLYVEKESRLELINAAAPFFFWVVQQTLWEDAILGIARLADKRPKGKDVLALRRVVPLLPAGELRNEVDSLVQEIDAGMKDILQWRHRHVAHRDLDLALGKSLRPLPDTKVATIDRLLDLMTAVLNRISNHFLRSETAYRSASLVHDAESLLYVIRDGLRREELRQQRLNAGEYRADDWDDDAPPI